MAAWACVGLLATVLAAGCGSDDEEEEAVEGPLPTGADDPSAYTEAFLARNPRAQLQPEHLAVVRLESDTAANDTCAERDGVDCLPYVFDEASVLTLSVDERAAELDRLALRDESGSVLLSLAPGDDPVSAVIDPGNYTLELSHVFAGDPSAPELTVFLRSEASPSVEPQDVAGSDDLTLDARTDCVRFTDVSFAGLDLSQTDLSAAVLDQAPRFDGAKLTDGTHGVSLAGHEFPDRYTYFKGADLTAVNLSGAHLFEADLAGVTLNNAHLVGANLNFTNLPGAKLSGATAASSLGRRAWPRRCAAPS